jgi:hypothetical protein
MHRSAPILSFRGRYSTPFEGRKRCRLYRYEPVDTAVGDFELCSASHNTSCGICEEESTATTKISSST